jgi:hypothetical protein
MHEHRTTAATASATGGAVLRLGPADDRHEREADHVSARASHGAAASRARSLRSEPGADASGVIHPHLRRAIAESRCSGQLIPDAVRSPLEQSIGADFGQVRIHTGQRADSLARSLRARAFTAGKDIFFRNGQYAPSSQAGQRVLAHELSHVVQQSSAGAQPGQPVVQRLIGFEFETDWGAHDSPDISKTSHLKTHKSYKQGKGFDVEVDEANAGQKSGYKEIQYEIEYVVRPALPETKLGWKRMREVIAKVVAETDRLHGLAGSPASRDLTTNVVSFEYPGTNPHLWVFPQAKSQGGIKANPQATIGLTLPAVWQFGIAQESDFAKTEREKATFGYASHSLALRSNKKYFTQAAADASGLKEASGELRGLVTLLALYIKSLNNPDASPAAYAKAYLPILAKTDFAAMFRRLPESERLEYQKDPVSFTKLVLDLVRQDPAFGKLKERQAVIPDELTAKFSLSLESSNPGMRALSKLTLRKWLKEIPNGVDLLTGQYYPALFGLGDLGDGAKKGKLVDAPPKGQTDDRMIMEFRSGSAMPLEPSKWLDYAFDYYNLVRRLHGLSPLPGDLAKPVPHKPLPQIPAQPRRSQISHAPAPLLLSAPGQPAQPQGGRRRLQRSGQRQQQPLRRRSLGAPITASQRVDPPLVSRAVPRVRRRPVTRRQDVSGDTTGGQTTEPLQQPADLFTPTQTLLTPTQALLPLAQTPSTRPQRVPRRLQRSGQQPRRRLRRRSQGAPSTADQPFASPITIGQTTETWRQSPVNRGPQPNLQFRPLPIPREPQTLGDALHGLARLLSFEAPLAAQRLDSWAYAEDLTSAGQSLSEAEVLVAQNESLSSDPELAQALFYAWTLLKGVKEGTATW